MNGLIERTVRNGAFCFPFALQAHLRLLGNGLVRRYAEALLDFEE